MIDNQGVIYREKLHPPLSAPQKGCTLNFKSHLFNKLITNELASHCEEHKDVHFSMFCSFMANLCIFLYIKRVAKI